MQSWETAIMIQKAGIKEGIKEGIQIGIKAFIADNVEERVPKDRVIDKLQKRFGVSESEAQEYYSKFAEK